MNFPSSPDWASGAFYGPTSIAAGPFPLGVYLTWPQYSRWQLEAQLVLNLEAQTAFLPLAKQFGVADPYAPIIAEVRKSLAASLAALGEPV